MSTTAPVPVHQRLPSDRKQIRIVQHSQLFYWWPVWGLGLLLGLVTYLGGGYMVVVPKGTEAVSEDSGASEVRLTKLPNLTRSLERAINDKEHHHRFYIHMADTGIPGVVFAIVLLLVIVSTNVPLRGMWSVVVILLILMLLILLYVSNIWEEIIYAIALLDIRINAAGYFFISVALFLIWLVTVVFFDRQVYIVFTPGQMKVKTEIGGGEEAFDTMGMVLQKQQSDLFRHWVLGLGGSGDLIVKTAGAHPREFHLSNVLFIGRKLQQIEEMLRDQPVVSGA